MLSYPPSLSLLTLESGALRKLIVQAIKQAEFSFALFFFFPKKFEYDFFSSRRQSDTQPSYRTCSHPSSLPVESTIVDELVFFRDTGDGMMNDPDKLLLLPTTTFIDCSFLRPSLICLLACSLVSSFPFPFPLSLSLSSPFFRGSKVYLKAGREGRNE